MSNPADFDDDDDDGEDEFYNDVDGMNDPQVRHLPPEPMISGNAVVTDIDGDRAMAPIGLPSSPKLYGQAALFENVTQFRVFWMREGMPVGIGVIDKDATEEEFISKFLPSMPQPGEVGKYRLRMLDQGGNSVGHEALTTISGDHAHLRRIRGTESGPATLHIPGLDVVRDQLAGAQLRAQNDLDAIRQRELSMQDERREMTRERVDMASQAAQGVQVLAEAMTERERAHADRVLTEQQARAREALEAERTRGEQQSTMTQGFFAAMTTQMQSTNESRIQADRARDEERGREWARERERMEVRARQEREEYELRRAKEREDAERIRRQEKDEAEERRRRDNEEWQRRTERERTEMSEKRAREDREEKERRDRYESELRIREQESQRRHEMRMEELRQSAATDREHNLQLAAQGAQRGNSLEATLVKAASVAKLLGFDLKDGVKFAKELVGSEGANAAGLTTVLDTAVDRIGGVIEKSIEARTAQMQMEAYRSGGVNPMFMQPHMLGADPDDEDDDEDEDEPALNPRRGHRPVIQQPAAAQAAPTPQAVPTPQVTPQAADARSALQAQRVSRNSMRRLAGRISKASPDQYVDLVLSAIGGEPTLLNLIEPVGLAAALVEAGVPENVAVSVHQATQEDGRLPPETFGPGGVA